MPRHRVPPKELRELWAKVPGIKCKGLCADSCGGSIRCSSMERALIEERAGHDLTSSPAGGSCSMLRNGRCSVYSIRPMICRLWGVVESMPCPHGCEAERILTDREGLKLVAEAWVVAGDETAESLRDYLDSVPHDVLNKMREWARGAPDLGGAIRNRTKARREFMEALGHDDRRHI